MRRGVFWLSFLASCGALLSVSAAPPAESRQLPRALRVVHRGETVSVPIRRLDGVEMVRLTEIAAALGGTVREEESSREVLLLLGGRRIRFEAGRSFVDVEGTTRVLRDPGRRRGGTWFVPLDFVARVLPDVIPGETRYIQRTRTFALGEFPRLTVEIGPRPGATRVTAVTDPPLPMRLEQTGDRVVISIAASFLETAFPGAAPGDGVVERVDLSRIEGAYRLEITTGENFGRLAQERDSGSFSLDFIRAGVTAASGASVLRGRPDPDLSRPPERTRPRGVRTVAIDAGHGGSDLGAASGGDGASEAPAEKELTLAIALALRDRLVNDHGLEVVMTRETDRALALDDRAVVANAARADLLVSLHLNASPSPLASGILVYHLSPGVADRTASGAVVPFVPWQLAQAEFVPESRRLAEALASELGWLEIRSAGVAHAPLRLLGGAAMPAVHVELGFLTSEADRRQLMRPEFRGKIAEALARGILRYRSGGPVPGRTRLEPPGP